MATPSKHTSLPPTGAISLALSLGLVCTLAGIVMTGYVTGYLVESKWLQFAWLLILAFMVPGGFIVCQNLHHARFEHWQSRNG